MSAARGGGRARAEVRELVRLVERFEEAVRAGDVRRAGRAHAAIGVRLESGVGEGAVVVDLDRVRAERGGKGKVVLRVPIKSSRREVGPERLSTASREA